MKRGERLRLIIENVGCVDADGEDSDVKPPLGDAVIAWGDEGHSGPGWYAWCGEYPEEGSVFIDGSPAPFPELAELLSKQAERDTEGSHAKR